MHRIGKVAFYAAREGDDGHGNDLTGWADAPFLRVRAEIEDTPGREVVLAGAVRARGLARLRFRAGQLARGISEADCVELDGQRWNIRSVVALGRAARRMEIVIEKGGAV